LLAFAAGPACLSGEADSPDVQGQPNDVKTVPGVYDGYEVVYPCPLHPTSYGIQGAGLIPMTTGDDVWNAGSAMCTVLKDVPSVFGCGGMGTACSGLGTFVEMDDWREVDTVIDRVGHFLRDHDWSLDVAVEVNSIPVASSLARP
jgi:hypothetical protein